MAKKRKSFLLRIQPELFDELQRWASQELRSVNGQIEFVLHQAVRSRKTRRGTRAPADQEAHKAPPSVDEPAG